MRIRITRLSAQRHALALVRADGRGESCELETRSYLLHDLVHHAVEAERPIPDGFWGLLAAGTSLAALADRERPAALFPGLMRAEALVAPMQSVWQGRLAPERYLALAHPGADPGVDLAFVQRVHARLRRLWGAWRATPFGGGLELRWPCDGEPRVLHPR